MPERLVGFQVYVLSVGLTGVVRGGQYLLTGRASSRDLSVRSGMGRNKFGIRAVSSSGMFKRIESRLEFE